MKLSILSGLSACAMLAGCGGKSAPPATASAAPVAMDWHKVVTDEDRTRLREWRQAWTTAVGKVRAAGMGAQLTREGALFEPDHALANPTPPPGHYHCRVFKLGANGTAMKDFTAYPYFDCTIDDEGEVSSFYKTSGSQRPVGLVFSDDVSRDVFLGTMMLGDEKSALDYGRDMDRDMAGFIQRVGDKRWRLILPYPRFESLLDVVELVPAG